jgi:hypothetical protein
MKICTKCKIQKPFANFSKDARTKDGLQGWCRRCKSKQAKLYSKTFIGHLRQHFAAIKQRCINPNHPAYKHYGGREIECRFKNANSFITYVRGVLGFNTLEKLKELTIDRIDNNGHYEPGNIQFITQAENMKNRRKLLTHCPHCGKILYQMKNKAV